MLKNLRLTVIIIWISVTLSGCSILEYIWLVPRASGEVSFNPKLSNTEILDIFAQVALPELKFHNQPSETYRNIDEGVIEIGYFQSRASFFKSSIAGFSTRAEIDRKQHTLSFIVKGAEIYYEALPVDAAVEKISDELSKKLE
ncbi:hypothetical protein [Methylomonas rivi]|uniref:Lipoprotein n=1 Tax=Methylomonas rivi TaxID=2952226 RepID=A0ABT1U6A4_9GAMM|nr:hypothetical protein [Methylomonas sp. WSC-6]MCQ8129389.1 hypothetical protein [Methylomonas sp. WSC-6]